MTVNSSTKTRIAMVGHGEFGSQLLPWLAHQNVAQVVFCVDPLPQTIGPNIPFYASFDQVPRALLESVQAIVDCTPKGQGPQNLARYKALGIPAVFQNGESMKLCPLFHTSVADSPPASPYLKIAKCSALSTMNVVLALQEQGLGIVKRIYATHYKINEKDQMLDMDYDSGPEITRLTDIPARVDVTYLRGKAHTNYVYHGNIHLYCSQPVSRKAVLQALMESRHVVVMNQSLDTFRCKRGYRTVVIKEGVIVEDNMIRLTVLSYTPEINFPQNAAAIKLLASKAQ